MRQEDRVADNDMDMDDHSDHFSDPQVSEGTAITSFTTTAASGASTLSTKAHPCLWVKRRRNLMLPYILATQPCSLSFDTEAELFVHYAWHIDQLHINHECPVTTCRMKLISEEQLSTHYKQMHPNVPIPHNLNFSKITASAVSKPSKHVATTSDSKRGKSSTPRGSPATTPPETPLSIKSRGQSKLHQSRTVSEGSKTKTISNGTITTSARQIQNVTNKGSSSKTYLDSHNKKDNTDSGIDDNDEDNTPPMVLGPFFKNSVK
ncbi:hypothetical protein FBU30_004011 [Linnemannia zychae]|nr:hypothetical protein FBU30_004011 [Linnemannia zychae]